MVTNRLQSALDRLEEAHWNLHQMERYYHEADPFRYSLNSFLRVLKEIPQLIQMEMQNEEGFKKWFANQKEILNKDELISDLSEKRNILVHRSMLYPNSEANIGVTEGRGVKLGMTFPMNPSEDSDVLLLRYINAQYNEDEQNDILGILSNEEESLPCIERSWKIPPFDEEILDIATTAWRKVGEVVMNTQKWLGEEPIQTNLECMHASNYVYMKVYPRTLIENIKNDLSNDVDFREILVKLKRLTSK
ncbi:hypothetical protein DXT76_13110 [Halobacillus trueperi]|uniref:Uncharacterized protein n=1 Tax=Halobacillus trueperi TaxID=156205 RepID=A0A3D8VM20_9BACI|nr:hypothetical protein [Halobacillus trueperi]RDY70385.1 hypothetical protein DXT76_13110 [Halobacillus trueperi]